MNPNQKLLNWYKRTARNLPFRNTKNPYIIWISEVMLQQTRVNAVIDSFNRFIEKFPTIESLNNSSMEEVLSAWKGLGYYSRAYNLKKGARYIIETYQGNFPDNLEQILLVPGIGEYTARAILSIAFGKPVAVLDGNVKRVLSRFLEYRNDIKKSSSHKELQILADDFLNKENPSFHNQAMMELGATVCLPTKPQCNLCPISKECIAHQKGIEETLPNSNLEKSYIEIGMNFYLLNWNHKILLVKDKSRRFFKTIYSLPFTIEGSNLNQSYKESKIPYSFLEKCKTEIVKKNIKHSITNHKINIIVYSHNLTQLEMENFSGLEILWTNINSLSSDFPSSIANKIIKSRGNVDSASNSLY